MAAPHPDRARIEAAVRELLHAIGEDPDRPGLAGTPSSVASAYAEFFSGIGVDAADALGEGAAVAESGHRPGELVIVKDIDFRSICEHHLLPFLGVVHIAYLPAERVAGLGRFSRAVDVVAGRPQLQERLSEELADAIERALEPTGVLVVVSASHGCVTARGARQAGSTTVTVVGRGVLAEASARAEAIALIGAGAE